MKNSLLLLFVVALCFGLTESFLPTPLPRGVGLILPKKGPQQRLSAKTDDEDDAGYGLVGTLTRQGPIPAFVRVFQSENYNAAVDKYMLRAKCGRTEAMANMDAFFNDPNGWLLKEAEYKKTGKKKPDYVNMGQSNNQLLLTAFWGTVSTYYIWRIYQYTVNGVDYKDNFWGF